MYTRPGEACMPLISELDYSGGHWFRDGGEGCLAFEDRVQSASSLISKLGPGVLDSKRLHIQPEVMSRPAAHTPQLIVFLYI